MIAGMPRIAIATNDFASTVALFRDELGMPVLDLSKASVPALGAKVAMCVPEGGSNIELMCPADPEAPLSQSLQRYLDRRGEGLFALMLEAPDPDAEAEVLSGRGLDVLPTLKGAAGRDIHPNSTHGVLIRVYPVDSFQGEAPASPEGQAFPELSGIARVIIAVRDVDHAALVYGRQLGMETEAPSLDRERGARASTCRPKSGGLIELVSPEMSDRPFARSIADHLDQRPEGMYALVLQSALPRTVCDVLTARGLDVRPAADRPDVFEVARESAFGALLRIEPSP
jgi:catechol 2,3-dioxygenase-like lactoylglutathione lyase family enzyme